MEVLLRSELTLVSQFIEEILPNFNDTSLCSAFKNVADFLMSYAEICNNPKRREMDNTVYVLADRPENDMRKCFCSTGLTKVADNMTIVNKMCSLLEYEICNLLSQNYGKHEGEWLSLVSDSLSNKEYYSIRNYGGIAFECLDESKQYALRCTGLGKVIIDKKIIVRLNEDDCGFFVCDLDKLRTLQAYLRAMNGKLK